MNRFTAACVAFAVQGTALRIHIEEAENGIDLSIEAEDGTSAPVEPEAPAEEREIAF